MFPPRTILQQSWFFRGAGSVLVTFAFARKISHRSAKACVYVALNLEVLKNMTQTVSLVGAVVLPTTWGSGHGWFRVMILCASRRDQGTHVFAEGSRACLHRPRAPPGSRGPDMRASAPPSSLSRSALLFQPPQTLLSHKAGFRSNQVACKWHFFSSK